MTVAAPRPASAEPTLATILLAGAVADATWEVWARGVTPFLVGGPLEPAALVQSVFGLSSRPLAEAIHLAVGILAYPLGYALFAMPLARAVAPGLPWWLVSLGYGVGLWVFALYLMAHVVAGLPPFLGFIPLTWASLAGHLVFALVLGAIVRRRGGA